MQKGGNNYAFIDVQNIYLGIKEQGWKLDWKKFYIYLQEKFSIKKAYIFVGYLEEKQIL